MLNAFHVPVLAKESTKVLMTASKGLYLDTTAGFGGHMQLILESLGNRGHLIAADRDQDSIAYLKSEFSDPRLTIIKTNFKGLRQEIDQLDHSFAFDGIIADLGVSSHQLDSKDRGFSFKKDADLDMRMDQSTGISAKNWINTAAEDEISDVIWKYGEESYSRKIAKAIIEQRSIRPISSTLEFADLIYQLKKYSKKKEKKHPATKTFQAIRIHINDELEELRSLLDFSLEYLKPGGRIVIISFHSLEDRIVKRFFRDNSRIDPNLSKLPNLEDTSRLKVILKKVKPSDEEIKVNPRARSAILRAAEKIK
ncbi:MAG: 16S rRNA (cytosine(1402)-N(4))-methyltransferase RsmH [Gammaproteobacteria bacterium]|tara:strand:+ start:87 stop:1016 length:930 start_codon:yes stop_codon:yes gene_type:complete